MALSKSRAEIHSVGANEENLAERPQGEATGLPGNWVKRPPFKMGKQRQQHSGYTGEYHLKIR